jgi:hypothetical protein
MRDDLSLAAAGYVEHQSLILIVSSSHAPAPAPVPLAIATDGNPRKVHALPKVQPAARPATSAIASSAAAAVKCASGHACSMHTYQNVHRKCNVCSALIENQSIGARCSTCDYDVCHECVSKIQTPTVSDFATQWLDDLGCICPKAVDYASQCPKGHALVAFAGGGGVASAQLVMCRVCHGSTQHQHARGWLTCSVAGCCAGYAVCADCVAVFGSAHKDSAASADNFCMMVTLLAHATMRPTCAIVFALVPGFIYTHVT